MPLRQMLVFHLFIFSIPFEKSHFLSLNKVMLQLANNNVTSSFDQSSIETKTLIQTLEWCVVHHLICINLQCEKTRSYRKKI